MDIEGRLTAILETTIEKRRELCIFYSSLWGMNTLDRFFFLPVLQRGTIFVSSCLFLRTLSPFGKGL